LLEVPRNAGEEHQMIVLPFLFVIFIVKVLARMFRVPAFVILAAFMLLPVLAVMHNENGGLQAAHQRNAVRWTAR